jgi:hypothetical protein
MAGFLDQSPQRPRISQQIVHPLPQALAILGAVH